MDWRAPRAPRSAAKCLWCSGSWQPRLEWVPVDRILDLPLWDGDRHFLPLVFDGDTRAFHGVMPYRDGRMQSWSYSRI